MRSPDDIVDDLLVLDAQTGDVAAFERLVTRWHPRLMRYARRLTDSSDGASDVVQETWLAIVRGLRRLNDPAKFAPWALRVTARRSADWIAARRRTREGDRAAHREAAHSDHARRHADALARVREVLRRLQPADRALMSMFYVEGLSVGEVAQVLGVPAGTVKSRLFHARERLRAALEVSRDRQD
jgi:RNA polymerase sigma factor (sigma-70 family)